VRGAAFSCAVLTATVLACGGSKPPPATPKTVSTRCPDLTRAEEVGTFDYAREYQVSRQAADKLKAAALTFNELSLLEDKLDGELGLACSQVASALGDKSPAGSGAEACASARKSVKDVRAKLGAKATYSLVVHAPICQVDASLLTKCAAICDGSVPADKLKIVCDPRVGRCDGTCDGTCDGSEPQACDGACSGKCEGTVRGSCGGRCRGTCDGKPAAGACAGTCVGTCSGGAFVGACNGQCTGACRYAKGSVCKELCAGTCSVDLADAKCAGGVEAPGVSADCRARCDLAAMTKAWCGTPQVGLVVTGGASKSSEEALRAAVEKSYPALLQILYEVGERGVERVQAADAVLARARAGFKEMARSADVTIGPATEAQLARCFDEPFAKASTSAASLKGLLAEAHALKDDVAR
jgi:hypothetical protein